MSSLAESVFAGLGARLRYPLNKDDYYREFPTWTLSSPTVVLATFGIYGALCLAFASVWSDRRAVAVPRWVVAAHNAVQVLLSGVMVVGLLAAHACAGYSFVGNTIFDPSRRGVCEEAVVGLIRLFTLSKYYDLVDTLIIVLAKKDRQLTFLHCAHHSVVPVAVWFGMWCSPSGDSYAPALVNSFVHLVMYSYYLLASLGIACPWKKLITSIQLMQFAFLFLFGLGCLAHRSIAIETTITNAVVQLWMLVGFGKFYRNEYTANSKQPTKSD